VAILRFPQVISKSLGLRKDDVALNAMPLFHIDGLSANLLASLAAGASVMCSSRFDASEFVDILTSPNELRPTWYSAVPAMHAAIHQLAEKASFQSSLRFIRSGGVAMPRDFSLKLEKAFKCPFIPTYSMTEQMPISQPPLGYNILRNKPNSVGMPVCTSVCIVDKNLRPVPYEKSFGGFNNTRPITGEICISGSMVIEGYAANSEANGDSFFHIGGMVIEGCAAADPEAYADSFFYMGGMQWFRTGDTVRALMVLGLRRW